MGSGGTFYNIFIDTTSPVAVKNISTTYPEKIILRQNYPNPFNQTTLIEFDIPEFAGDNFTILSVYDVLGREVKNLLKENLKPGNYKKFFDAGNLPSGIYFYKLSVGDYSVVKTMIYLK